MGGGGRRGEKGPGRLKRGKCRHAPGEHACGAAVLGAVDLPAGDPQAAAQCLQGNGR